MPNTQRRITQEELKTLKYISMADFSKRIDMYTNIHDKLSFASQYLILHGSNGEPDCSIEDAINIARMKIAEASVPLKEKVKAIVAAQNNKKDAKEEEDEIEIIHNVNPLPYAVDPLTAPENDLELEQFMGHPVDYLKAYALKKYNQISRQGVISQNDTKSQEICMNFYNNARTISNSVLNVQARNSLHIKNRLETMFGGKAALEKAYRDTQPSFLSKMFATSSAAARNLDAVYKAYTNPNHVLYGDLKALTKASNEYIMHKFPEWKPGKPLPTDKDINKLDSTEKARTVMSIAILKAVDKETKIEGTYETIVKGCASQETLQQQLDEINASNQAELQRRLVESLNEEVENNILPNLIDRDTHHEMEQNVERQKEADESVLDLSLEKHNDE